MQATDYDPYQVLEVHPKAPLNEIKRAFRERVMKCHPDKGGTHEAMVAVAKAWEVLSDPNLRAQYDEARSRQQDQLAQVRWARGEEEAASRARMYTQSWEAFYERMAAVYSDVRRAEYGSFTFFHSFAIPLARNSISAVLFIVLSAALGVGIYIWLLMKFRSSLEQKWAYGYFCCGAFFLSTSGWIGYRLHRTLRDAIRRQEKTVLSCPACGQKMRLPEVSSRVEVTCGNCRTKFCKDTDWKDKIQELDDSLKVLRQDRKALVWMTAIIVFMGFQYIKGMKEGTAEGITNLTKVVFGAGYTRGYSDGSQGHVFDLDGAATRPTSGEK